MPSKLVEATWHKRVGTPSTVDSQVPQVPASQPRFGRSQWARKWIAQSADMSDHVANETSR
jgi:hypothetical protein